MEGKCFCCGKPVHRFPTCHFKNKPREEWAIHKHQQSFAQSNGSSTTVSPSQSTSSNQVDQAKQAHALYHAIGTSSVPDFEAILRMNMISKNPVTTGPDIGALKGKTI
jgi:hypothetical protein